MKIYIASDHAGFKFKEKLMTLLEKEGHTFEDLGTYTKEAVDYPDYARKLAMAMRGKGGAKGVLICGSGTGMCIAANRHKHLRAAEVYDLYTAKMARADNDANVICLRARGKSPSEAKKLVQLFLKTAFSKKIRHKRRVEKIS